MIPCTRVRADHHNRHSFAGCIYYPQPHAQHVVGRELNSPPDITGSMRSTNRGEDSAAATDGIAFNGRLAITAFLFLFLFLFFLGNHSGVECKPPVDRRF